MSSIFIPQPIAEAISRESIPTSGFLATTAGAGTPKTFEEIKKYATDFRNKLLRIAQFMDQHGAQPEDRIDLTDECVAIQIRGEDILNVLSPGGFKDLIALLSIADGHLTISLLGADPQNPEIISPLYNVPNTVLKGSETWPRRGLLGQTKDFKDVLDCK